MPNRDRLTEGHHQEWRLLLTLVGAVRYQCQGLPHEAALS
jgi:hypothetical protein